MMRPRRLPAARTLTTTCIARNNAEPSAIPETPTAAQEVAKPAGRARSDVPMSRNAASHSHRKSFVQWVNGPGKTYARPAEGRNRTNYLDGKTHPFPLNPAFQPTPPLSSSVKQQIVEDWKVGVGLRQLSTKWGVSLERIDAILKLQQVREKWDAQGRRTMQSYAETMDSMLGTQSQEFGSYEPKHNIKIDPGRQIFTLIPEAASYTPEDAAEELGKVPFGKRQEQQLQQFIARSPFEAGSTVSSLLNKKDVAAEIQVQPADKAREDRWTFKIRDTAGKEAQVLRKQDGSLVKLEQTRNTSRSKWSMSV